MMQRLEGGLTDGIAVARLDRLSRAGVGDALKLVERIDQLGGELAAVDLGIDPTTTFGEFSMTVMLALARMERRRLTESWGESRRRAVERGVHIASRPPTGFTRDADGRLSVDPDAARAIQAVFKTRADGASWSDAATVLEEAGVRTPYGSENWSQRSLTHLVSNRAYLGEARSGEFVNPDAHEAIVSESLWLRAQRKPGSRSPRGNSLLAGIIRCAGCRYALKPDKMAKRNKERVRTYRCKKKRAGGTCGAPATVLGSVIEPWVEEQFFERVGDLKLSGVEASLSIKEAEQELEAAEAELSAFVSATSALQDSMAFRSGAEQRQEVVSAAESKLLAAQSRAGLDRIPSVVELRRVWPDLSFVEKQEILSGAIHAVFLRSTGRANVPVSERARVVWRGEGNDDDLPGPGRRGGEIVPFDW